MSALAEPLTWPFRDRPIVQRPPAIGSVLPMPPPAGRLPPDALWAAWTAGYRHASAYGSARSALAALLAFHGIERVWLPAYSCPALMHAAIRCQTLWYGVDERLAPDVAQLAGLVRSGDAVLGIDYFGRSPGPAFAALASAHPDILWIEDRAQALAPDAAAWGDVLLYSPRKLIGIGEGGLLVSNVPLPKPAEPATYRSAQAQIARAADPDGRLPDSWFAAFQAQEAAFQVDDSAMADQARDVLYGVQAPALVARRKANAATLAGKLQDLALWPDAPIDFAPLAFPICVQDCPQLAAGLAEAAIYCARHWPTLPSDPKQFSAAHRLAGALLSLPCDHRYGAADMLRIVDALRARRARRLGGL